MATMSSSRNVLIHVFDEYRKTAKDFICRRDVLLGKMKYFRAYLNQSNEHDEIDISVHCDVEIFEWLVEYMQQRESEWRSRITLDNIASILVSSEFLQMDVLVEECIRFITGHMQDFLQLRVDFSCLSDNTITKIAQRCSADELQRLQDPKDKMLSKLLRKKVEALLSELQQGSSLLCCCADCDMIYLSKDAPRLHCSRGTRKLTVRGEMIAVHQAKAGWVPDEWVRGLVQDKSLSWSAAYWFIWASTQCFHCVTCRCYCSLLDYHDCMYHPGPVAGVGADAKFGCCMARIFLGGEFDGVGCKTRDHTVSLSASSQLRINVELLDKHWELIASSKQLMLTQRRAPQPPTMDMSIIFASHAIESPSEIESALKRSLPPSAEATSPRRRSQWQTLRLQEEDRVRMQLLTKRLIQLRKNLTV